MALKRLHLTLTVQDHLPPFRYELISSTPRTSTNFPPGEEVIRVRVLKHSTIYVAIFDPNLTKLMMPTSLTPSPRVSPLPSYKS